MNISTVIKALREYKGITRKSILGDLLLVFGNTTYDDAGVIEVDDLKAVVSADGIVEDLVRDDPWLAGFYSVLVNVNDVVAKGARPLGYVNIISASCAETREKIAKGIKYGLDKYHLKLLKGHTHPDTSFDAIDGAVIGITKNYLSSADAKVGDSLVVAVDLEGKFGVKGWVKIYDSVLAKSDEEVLNRLEAMINIAEKGLANAARDISGPGIIGTIAMLCESSSVGAEVDLETIPKPKDAELLEWLMAYPAIGFVLSTRTPTECVSIFKEHNLAATVVGKVTKAKTIQLCYKDQREILMNLNEESVFGLK